eukprot:COSAG02_NODE_872_length_16321_cov_6.491062_2_plen_169_part_00
MQINVDEAYKNLTATLGNQYSLHPVPGTDDGKPNPDYIREIIASMPNGSEWLWGADQPGLHSDPFQGGAYHISKTKDAASGHRWERLKRFLAVVPVDTTVHSDAYRDINDSWENDERGFISEDEEVRSPMRSKNHPRVDPSRQDYSNTFILTHPSIVGPLPGDLWVAG